MRILALDMATKTGWAFWDGRLVGSGVVNLGEENRERALYDLIRSNATVDFVVVESPVSYKGRISHGARLDGAARLTCSLLGIGFMDVPNQVIKKHATGKGNAKKPDMIVAARERWGIEIIDDNHADALCLLGYILDRGEFSKTN
jgi:Holliday junction resolvasome RuvABC endonuclease subunit